MWQHEATKRNAAQLRADGVTVLEPDEGEMACGEYGPGRLPEPETILAAIQHMLGAADPLADQPDFAPSAPLAGRHVIVTAGPTHEPIDPVRVIANRSSGKQGFAIAEALAALGARVTLVAGPVSLATPAGVTRRDVETAAEMEQAVLAALPADAAVLVAAVADWRVEPAPEKLKKEAGPPVLDWQRTPDILAGLATIPNRPRLIVGFAAETENVPAEAAAKRARKGADWIVANDVSGDVMGGDANAVHLITDRETETWDRMSKADVARRLARKIADAIGTGADDD
jgi:phosphopantothenoylcysteine decarboxylase/phosphopantothenate--cysteine ligase